MKGLILFAHGARDAAWAEPFIRLRDLLKDRVRDTPVELAYLELMQPDLEAALDGMVAHGCSDIEIVPIFFGQGGHIRRDLPRLVDGLRRAHPGIEIGCSAPAGEDESVLSAIASYCLQALDRAEKTPSETPDESGTRNL